MIKKWFSSDGNQNRSVISEERKRQIYFIFLLILASADGKLPKCY